MKKTIAILFLQFVAIVSLAQFDRSLNVSNTKTIFAIVSYYKNNDGFFNKIENSRTNYIEEYKIQKYYAYDKKNKKLYFVTDYGNYVAELKDEYAKKYKKSTSIPQLKEKDITILIDSINNDLAIKISYINNARQEQIDRMIEQARLDSIKARLDSIKMAREREIADSLYRIEVEQKRLARIKQEEKYIKTHNWKLVPTGYNKIYCVFCEENVETNDTIICVGTDNNTIVWMDQLNGAFDIKYNHIHKGGVPFNLKNKPEFSFHYEVFKDSLKKHYNSIDDEELEQYNSLQIRSYLSKVQKKIPNGYFVDWSWDNDFSLSFDFKYRNTNKKTLKYIEVFWKAINPVGDVRNTGSFKGTGPVETWDAGRWKWDSSHYYLAGDVSRLIITKVIITYMDKSQVVIPQNKLKFS